MSLPHPLRIRSRAVVVINLLGSNFRENIVSLLAKLKVNFDNYSVQHWSEAYKKLR